jgi:excisionase family DNA binding protein
MIKPVYLTIPQVAKILGISRIAVYKRVKKGQIKATKIGRNYAVPKNALSPQIKQVEYASTLQLAQELNVHRSTIYRRAKKGIVSGMRLGRNFVLVSKYIQEQKKKEQCVSIPELASQLGVSRVTVYKRVKKGLIAAVRDGGDFVVEKKHAVKLILREKQKLKRTTKKKNELDLKNNLAKREKRADEICCGCFYSLRECDVFKRRIRERQYPAFHSSARGGRN